MKRPGLCACYVFTAMGLGLLGANVAFWPAIESSDALGDFAELGPLTNGGFIYLSLSQGAVSVACDATCSGWGPPFLHRRGALRVPIWAASLFLVAYPWILVGCARLARQRFTAASVLKWSGLLVSIAFLALFVLNIRSEAHSGYRDYPFGFVLVALVVAVPTVLLWKYGRCAGPSHCAGCGYNLTGNVSGVCPECGQAAETTAS